MAYDEVTARLIRENESLKREVMSAEGEWVGHKTLAALRNDAERYRWLRDCGSLTWVPFRSQWKMDAEHCDAAIDNEMSRQRLFGAA